MSLKNVYDVDTTLLGRPKAPRAKLRVTKIFKRSLIFAMLNLSERNEVFYFSFLFKLFLQQPELSICNMEFSTFRLCSSIHIHSRTSIVQ